MPSKKRPLAIVEEYDVDTSEDESSTQKRKLAKPALPLLHRHTHIETANGRLTAEQILYKMPSSPKLIPIVEADTIPDDDQESPDLSSMILDEPDSLDRHQARQTARPLLQWLPEIDNYLHELLRHEGRGNIPPGCQLCGVSQPEYRCVDCWNHELLCKNCIVEYHKRSSPFHRIQKWSGRCFEQVSLQSLGLRVQLNHPYGERCPNPVSCYNDEFTVIDLNGIHKVTVDYCGCHLVQSRPVQLLRSRLYPATVVDPRTAATFHILEFFHMITLVSKISAFDFYTTLSRKADNTGTKDIPYRYPAFLLMIRQWRHLKLLKRKGRGHDAGGRKSTGEGECAVLCPACPHPGKNLPNNWKEAPPNQQWLYTLFVGLDANFRLKRLNVSKAADDPDLNQGCAYFVNDESFQQYLRKFNHKVPNDTSTCSNYDAIKLASMRGGKGTATTGVGTVECIRHDMKRPVSVGDLQKGERYVNMDFFFFSSLRQNSELARIVISYDIACQWSKNLRARADLYGVDTDILRNQSVTFAVPKAHLPVHQDACKARYSFNLLPRVGRTDGEAPERGWAATNAVANSTKEMGPGSRRDTLDDHFGDYNWRKVTKLAPTLFDKFTEAFNAQSDHTTAFEDFSSALPQDNVSAWAHMVREWERDPSMPNPYELKEKRISEAQVRLKLAMEDTTNIDDTHVQFEITPSMLIAQGLELEEQQRRLRHESKSLGPHVKPIQRAKIVEWLLRLQRQIDAWKEFQHLYMPGVAMLRARNDQEVGGTPTVATEIELMMPSQVLEQINCDGLGKLIEHEWQLRYAQATDTLHELQQMLLIRRELYKSKERYGIGQRHHTRSVSMIKHIQDKVQRAVNKYRFTYQRLTVLASRLKKEGWENVLRPLLDEDIRAPDEEETLSEGHHSFTWVWRAGSIGSSDSAMQEGNGLFSEVALTDSCGVATVLRIEWCKARARVHRWQEECVLVKEEMRRVLQFFDWEISRWNGFSAPDPETKGPDMIEGLRAYAYRQVDIQLAMREHCSQAWKNIQNAQITFTGKYIDKETGFIEYP